MDTEREKFLDQALELAYQCFDIGLLAKRQKFRGLLEDAAISFVSYLDKYYLSYLEKVFKLGVYIGEIDFKKAELFNLCLDNLNKTMNSKTDSAADLKDVNKELDNASNDTELDAYVMPHTVLDNSQDNDDLSNDAIDDEDENQLSLDIGRDNGKMPLSRLLANQIRHSAILNKISDLGRCQLRDLVKALPEMSERILRYDLHKLCEQGRLERTGGGGISSFYQMKQQ